MFKRKITNEQRKAAWKIVSQTNMGNRGEFDGNKNQQYTGMLGEIIMADMLGFDRPNEALSDRNKKGIDFVIYGRKVDLKTMARDYDVRDNYVNDLYKGQVDSDYSETEIYAFSSINKKKGEITFIGIIPKNWIKEEWLHLKGELRRNNWELPADAYEIPMSALLQASSPQEWLWNFDRI